MLVKLYTLVSMLFMDHSQDVKGLICLGHVKRCMTMMEIKLEEV